MITEPTLLSEESYSKQAASRTNLRQTPLVLLIAGAHSWSDWIPDFVRPNDIQVEILYEPTVLSEITQKFKDFRFDSIVFMSHHSTLLEDAARAESLAALFSGPIIAQPLDVGIIAYDKRRMAVLASQQRWARPIPEFSISDAEKYLANPNAAVIVKPPRGTEGVGFFVIETVEKLAASKKSPETSMLIQPYIQGLEYSLNMYRVNGSIRHYPLVEKGATSRLGVHPSKRRRFCPPRVINEADQTAMQNAATAMAEAMELEGLCEFEFIVSVDGSIYLVEINPRVAATMRMSSLAAGSSIFDDYITASLFPRSAPSQFKGQRFAAELPVPLEVADRFPKGKLSADLWVTSRFTVAAESEFSLAMRISEIERMLQEAMSAPTSL